MICRKFALAAAGLLFSAASAFSQITAIQGDAKGADGQPVNGAQILIEREDLPGTYRHKTNKKGHYKLDGLPIGTYTVSVIVDGKIMDSVSHMHTRVDAPAIVDFDLAAHTMERRAQQAATNNVPETHQASEDMMHRRDAPSLQRPTDSTNTIYDLTGEALQPSREQVEKPKTAQQPTVPTNAAQSWQGLQFGMAYQQVHDILLTKNFSVRDGRDGAVKLVEPDFELRTNSAILSSNWHAEIASASMFFKPELTFSAQGGLQTIKLDLDQAKVFQSAPAFRHSGLPLLTEVAATSVFEQLTGKYGTPVAMRGPCNRINVVDLIVGEFGTCSAKWKDAGQTIELFWSYNSPLGELSFFITYSDAASGL